ncbi:uncharacterized protein LOC141909197 [Tubulanus polymorphus]|uniref:uncharacterized protein LOC141909197 n=1 Tax=Tubulanus polymorphus TaxID=672921 RepID=UPI003DA40C86
MTCNLSYFGPTFWGHLLQNGYNSTSHAGRVFMAVFIPVNSVLGLAGNLTAFAVLILTPSLRKCGYSAILLVLACSDSVALISRLVIWGNLVVAMAGRGLGVSLDTTAKCLVTEQIGATSFIDAALIVLITLERFVVMCVPKLKSYCTFENVLKAALFALVICVTICVAITSSIIHVPECEFGCVEPRFRSKIKLTIASIIIGPLPVALICLFNGQTLHKLVSPRVPKHHRRGKGIHNKTTRATIMLLVTSFSYATITTPYCVVLFIKYFSANKSLIRNMNNYLFLIRCLVDLNYSVNFFLYYVSGQEFRAGASRLIGRPVETRPDETTPSTTDTLSLS